jgi:hypothetical protein
VNSGRYSPRGDLRRFRALQRITADEVKADAALRANSMYARERHYHPYTDRPATRGPLCADIVEKLRERNLRETSDRVDGFDGINDSRIAQLAKRSFAETDRK